MASWCFICVNVILVSVLVDISVFIMLGGILFKILILGINEMALLKLKNSEFMPSTQLIVLYCITKRVAACFGPLYGHRHKTELQFQILLCVRISPQSVFLQNSY